MSIVSGRQLLLSSAAAAAATGISRSLRFNSSDSAFCSRTFSTPTGNTRWTYALWVKRSTTPAVSDVLLSANYGSGLDARISFFLDNTFYYADSSASLHTSAAVYRDFSAWMHVVFVYDSPNATSTERLRLYINGTRITASNGLGTTSYPSQNAGSNINAAQLHTIGQFATVTGHYLNGYLADIHFIDGQALDPTSFGQFDATTGVWVPKAYTGTYGTNGFKLDFADNSSNTATTLGKDTSGNGNNWTPNNLQATDQSNYVSGSSTYRQSTSANQNWNSSSSASSTSSALSPDRIFWVDLGSSKSFNKVTFTCVAANNTGNYASNFIVYYSTSGSSTGSSICNGGCTVTKTPTTSGPTPGTITVEFSGISAVSGQYIGITNGTGADTGTYTYSNFQVALSAPAGNDSLVDVPTNGAQTDTGVGGEVRGNYCTWNPIGSGSGATLTNGNLDYSLTGASSAVRRSLGTIALPMSGKWYWECTVTTVSEMAVGVADFQTGQRSLYYQYAVGGFQNIYINDSQTAAVAGYTNNDVIGIGYDADNQQIRWYKNNTQVGTNYSLTNTGRLMPCAEQLSGSAFCAGSANFGQRPFAYTAPSGFKALCTTNLPAPSVTKPSTVFDTLLWTGNGSARSITGLGFNPDLVWIKSRSAATDHELTDSVRGTTKSLSSNLTAAEATDTGGLTAFNSDGFSLGTDTKYNNNAATYAGWCWDAGSSTVTNTQGSITGTVSVRANPTAGFSVVTFTAQTSGSASIGHGLNAEPHLIIVKSRAQTYSWLVYHKYLTSNAYYLILNSTAAQDNTSNAWNSTTPTSTVFTLGSTYAGAGNTVAYCFAPVVGYSSFGSYVSNGSLDGPFVYTGFRPRWVLIKITSTVSSWTIWDSQRDTYNLVANDLSPDLANYENQAGVTGGIDFLSNGFKLRSTDGWINSASSYTYIYAAFAESPFNYARAR